jgi:2-oxoglutarate dehydrogenase complex dehydrogenase (E1) component-like enzyme
VDEPEFTQPKMYHQIRKVHIPSSKKYSTELDEANVTQDFYNTTRNSLFEKLEKEFNVSKEIEPISLK